MCEGGLLLCEGGLLLCEGDLLLCEGIHGLTCAGTDWCCILGCNWFDEELAVL